MEHPDTRKSVKVTDISMSPSGELNPPCIEVIHPETPQTSVGLLTMFKHMTDQLGSVFELMIAYLCGLHIQPRGGLQLQVIQIRREPAKSIQMPLWIWSPNGHSDRAVRVTAEDFP
jgi:hypothetical protein